MKSKRDGCGGFGGFDGCGGFGGFGGCGGCGKKLRNAHIGHTPLLLLQLGWRHHR